MCKSAKTLDYYNVNAAKFVDRTLDLDFSEIADEFLSFLKPGNKVLDLGCGSGRDSLYFIEQGMDVVAVDGSSEICREVKSRTGLNVRNLTFDKLSDVDIYDGIFASASLLHLNSSELKDVLTKVIRALKTGGIVYMGFKYGDFEGFRDGRFFNDMNEDKLLELLSQYKNLKVLKLWMSEDIRDDRVNQWMNVIVKKI